MSSPNAIAEVLSVLVAGSLIGLNIRAMVKLWGSFSYSKNQKLAQTALVWFVPVLGALLVWALSLEEVSSQGAARLDSTFEPELSGLYNHPQSIEVSHVGHDFDLGE